jgi:hypothetical protein
MIGRLVRYYDIEESHYTYGIIISDEVDRRYVGLSQDRVRIVWFDDYEPTSEIKSVLLPPNATPEIRKTLGGYIELIEL